MGFGRKYPVNAIPITQIDFVKVGVLPVIWAMRSITATLALLRLSRIATVARSQQFYDSMATDVADTTGHKYMHKSLRFRRHDVLLQLGHHAHQSVTGSFAAVPLQLLETNRHFSSAS